MTKIELGLIINNEWTKSLLIYFLGLQVISIILTLFKGPSSAFLGIGFLGVSFMNIFFAPRQFAFDRINARELMPGTASILKHIISRLLVLWTFNVFCFLPLVIIFVFTYDIEDINPFILYFIFCFGFVSPADILFSSLNEQKNNAGQVKRSIKYKSICLVIGAIPLIPFPIMILLNSSQTNAMNVFALSGLLILLFTPFILRAAERNTSRGKL